MFALGSTGDVRPYLLLGKRLQGQGHVITLAAFSNFKETVEGAGLRFFPLAGDARDVMRRIMSPNAKGPNYLVE